ncbi:MAG: Mur ligase family protein [Planctomycetota bacterium]
MTEPLHTPPPIDTRTLLGDLSGCRVTVLGLGRFGGGVGVTRWLASRGCRVLVTDAATADKLTDSVNAVGDLLKGGSVSLRLGGHEQSDFTDADVVVANPAVPKPWTHESLLASWDAGVPVTTEIALALAHLESRGIADRQTIAITGTAGKSTTTAMTSEALRAAMGPERVLIGGNLGGSLLGARTDGVRALVLEVSSAMLWWLEHTLPGWRPHVGVLTGYAPNHVDWHGDEVHYRSCKGMLTLRVADRGTALLGSGVTDWQIAPGATSETPSLSDAPRGLLAPGAHNRQNAAMALAAARALLGTAPPTGAMRSAVAAFPGLPHRVRTIGFASGVRCVDDSKSTTPEASVRAVRALRPETNGRLALLAGGYDKGVSLAALAAMREGPNTELVDELLVFGTTGPALAALRQDDTATRCFETLDQAVASAAERLSPGDTLLLSPACASWDQFEHFEARGRAFADACERHLGPLSDQESRDARA